MGRWTGSLDRGADRLFIFVSLFFCASVPSKRECGPVSNLLCRPAIAGAGLDASRVFWRGAFPFAGDVMAFDFSTQGSSYAMRFERRQITMVQHAAAD